MNSELSIGTVLSHYRIVSRIGAGGMGVIYRASDVRLTAMSRLRYCPLILRMTLRGFSASSRKRARRVPLIIPTSLRFTISAITKVRRTSLLNCSKVRSCARNSQRPPFHSEKPSNTRDRS